MSDMKIHQADTLTGEQRALLAQISQVLSGQIGQGVTPYGPSYTAGASGTQQSQYDLIQNMLSGAGGTPLDTLSQILKPYDKSGAEQYYQNALVAPAMDTWEKKIKPSVLEPFAGMDALDSGASRRALAEAGGTMNTNLSAQLEDLLYKGEQAHNQEQIQGLNYGNSLIGALNAPGATERGIQSEQLMEPYQKWQMSQPYSNPWLQYLFPDLGVKAFENIVEAPQQKQGGGFDFGGLAKGIGGLLGGIASFF